jgi:hypothetical protein
MLHLLSSGVRLAYSLPWPSLMPAMSPVLTHKDSCLFLLSSGPPLFLRQAAEALCSQLQLPDDTCSDLWCAHPPSERPCSPACLPACLPACTQPLHSRSYFRHMSSTRQLSTAVPPCFGSVIKSYTEPRSLLQPNCRWRPCLLQTHQPTDHSCLDRPPSNTRLACCVVLAGGGPLQWRSCCPLLQPYQLSTSAACQSAAGTGWRWRRQCWELRLLACRRSLSYWQPVCSGVADGAA